MTPTARLEPRVFAVKVVPDDHYLRERHSDCDIYEITVEHRGGALWAVKRGGQTFDGQDWEFEPIPSSRTLPYLRRHRHDFERAGALALRAADAWLAELERRFPA